MNIRTADLPCCFAGLGLAAPLDRRTAWLSLPRIGWPLLATYVSEWVALNNADPLFAGQ